MQTQFYAIEDDFLPVLNTVEQKGPLKYTLRGRFLTPELKSYSRGADLPNLGTATDASAVGCDAYLVCEPSTNVRLEVVDETDGVRSYHVNQLLNPDTIVCCPGGRWSEELLFYGYVGTASPSATSKQILNRFRTAIRRHFTSIRGVAYVGPKALIALKQGRRLTLSTQTPPEFDLRLT